MSIETLISEQTLAIKELTVAVNTLNASVEASNVGREQAVEKIAKATGSTVEKAAETVAKAATKTEEAPKATRAKKTEKAPVEEPAEEPEADAPLAEITDIDFGQKTRDFMTSKSPDEAKERTEFVKSILAHAGGTGKIFERITDNEQRHLTLKIFDLYKAGERYNSIDTWYEVAAGGSSNSDEDDIA